MDQDQLNPFVANEGYVVRVPHNPLVQLQLIQIFNLIMKNPGGSNLVLLIEYFIEMGYLSFKANNTLGPTEPTIS